MTPTKLLIGQITIVFAIVILGVWAATQWAAAMLAHQPELGAPWIIFAGFPIYRPWALFAWWLSGSAGRSSYGNGSSFRTEALSESTTCPRPTRQVMRVWPIKWTFTPGPCLRGPRCRPYLASALVSAFRAKATSSKQSVNPPSRMRRGPAISSCRARCRYNRR